MSHSFTLVPKGDFWAIVRSLTREADFDASIFVAREGPDTALYFCGDRRVAMLSDAGEGLACIRLLTGSCVIHVDLEGYEGSVIHLERWFEQHRSALSPFAAYDDETGLDLTWDLERLPKKIFGPPPEFVAGV